MDWKAGRHWSPLELCDQCWAQAEEQTSVEPASIEVHEVEEPTPAAEPILVEGSLNESEEGVSAPSIGEEAPSVL